MMGHNGGVVDLVTLAGVVLQDSNDEDFGLQAGPYAFFFFVAMGLSLVFLLLSMRKQIRRVRFNEDATTDAGRMTPPAGTDEAGPS